MVHNDKDKLKEFITHAGEELSRLHEEMKRFNELREADILVPRDSQKSIFGKDTELIRKEGILSREKLEKDENGLPISRHRYLSSGNDEVYEKYVKEWIEDLLNIESAFHKNFMKRCHSLLVQSHSPLYNYS